MNCSRPDYHREHEVKHSSIGSHLGAIEKISQFGEASIINEARAGIRLAGLTVHSVGHISDSESGTSGKVALGQYNTGTKKISLAGFDQLKDSAEARGVEIRDHVADVLNHEKRHRESASAEGYLKTIYLLDKHFGDGAAHAVEEGMASDGLTDAFDAYEPERLKASQIAAQLGISTKELYQIKKEGDYKKLFLLILKSGKAANDDQVVKMAA